MKTVKCAVVGAGWWGTTAHIPTLKRHPLAELVAVHSCNADKAHQVATDFCVPHACTTMQEVLVVEGLEAVVISSTPNVHYAQALAALQRDLHVLIEKPMTIKAAESEELVALAEKQGVHFLVSCPWHYTAHSREARRLIQSGALGQLKLISVLMTNFNLGSTGAWQEEIFGAAPRGRIPPGPISHRVAPLTVIRRWRGRPDLLPDFPRRGAPGLPHRAAPGRSLRPVRQRRQRWTFTTLNLKLEDGTLVSIASTGATPHSSAIMRSACRHPGRAADGTLEGKMECHLFDGR